jgi:hypothetical protein
VLPRATGVNPAPRQPQPVSPQLPSRAPPRAPRWRWTHVNATTGEYVVVGDQRAQPDPADGKASESPSALSPKRCGTRFSRLFAFPPAEQCVAGDARSGIAAKVRIVRPLA